MEGARLGQVGHVIVRDQFGCISELHGKDPGGLLIGTGIPGPADEIQQFAVTAALINLRVEDQARNRANTRKQREPKPLPPTKVSRGLLRAT